MAQSVGGTSCDKVVPDAPPAKKERVLTWIVPGLSGIGSHKLGLNDSEWQFTLVLFDVDADCDAWALLINAMQSTIVTIVDDHADSYTGMLITQVGNPRKTVAAYSNGSILDKRCEITIRGVIV
jgi:hypothetical protein